MKNSTINDQVNALVQMAEQNVLTNEDIQIIEMDLLELEYPEIYHLPIPEVLELVQELQQSIAA